MQVQGLKQRIHQLRQCLASGIYLRTTVLGMALIAVPVLAAITIAEQQSMQEQKAHAALLAAAPLARRPSAVASLAAAGVALFSGSCYAVALMEDRKYGALAPVGGFCLIGAWLALAL